MTKTKRKSKWKSGSAAEIMDHEDRTLNNYSETIGRAIEENNKIGKGTGTDIFQVSIQITIANRLGRLLDTVDRLEKSITRIGEMEAKETMH